MPNVRQTGNAYSVLRVTILDNMNWKNQARKYVNPVIKALNFVQNAAIASAPNVARTSPNLMRMGTVPNARLPG